MADNLTEEQIAEFKEAFLLFDKNNDGHISAEELGDVLRTLDRSLSQLQLQAMMNAADENSNGTIEFDEFVLMMTKKIKEWDTQEELRQVFKLFDKDDDGYITVEEFREVMGKLEDQSITEEEVEKIVKKADLDGDGQVNYEEFVIMTKAGYSESGENTK